MSTEKSPGQLVEHFFRYQYGRLVSLLSKVFGLRHLDVIEDMVQASLLQALQSWKTRGVPDEPAAWIYRVAKNRVVDALRRDDTARRAKATLALQGTLDHVAYPDQEAYLDSEIEDSQLRMIFACSHPSLTMEARLALTLKTLCGFGRAEIARALLTNEETVKKRISRAKNRLIDEDVLLEVPKAVDLPERLETVHAVLYLIFNEGYSATSSEQVIRRDLCEEAARLCHLLCDHAHCCNSATLALMALMLFHAARFDARLDHDGLVLLLDEQDRSCWDYGLIRKGFDYLRRARRGKSISRFHLEAGIAMYHCEAAGFADTEWDTILRHYDLLLEMQRSPIYVLNRAIALSFAESPTAGIAALEEIRDHPQMQDYHLLDATLGELHRRAGDLPHARAHFENAIRKAKSTSDKQTMARRLALC